MIMIVEIPDDIGDFSEVITEIENAGKQEGLQIHVMHEDIFDAMHTV